MMHLRFIYFSVFLLILFYSKELLSQDITQIDYSQISESKLDLNKYRDVLDDVKFDKPKEFELTFTIDLNNYLDEYEKPNLNKVDIIVPEIFTTYLSEMINSKSFSIGNSKLVHTKFKNDIHFIKGQKFKKELVPEDYEERK